MSQEQQELQDLGGMLSPGINIDVSETLLVDQMSSFMLSQDDIFDPGSDEVDLLSLLQGETPNIDTEEKTELLAQPDMLLQPLPDALSDTVLNTPDDISESDDISDIGEVEQSTNENFLLNSPDQINIIQNLTENFVQQYLESGSTLFSNDIANDISNIANFFNVSREINFASPNNVLNVINNAVSFLNNASETVIQGAVTNNAIVQQDIFNNLRNVFDTNINSAEFNNFVSNEITEPLLSDTRVAMESFTGADADITQSMESQQNNKLLQPQIDAAVSRITSNLPDETTFIADSISVPGVETIPQNSINEVTETLSGQQQIQEELDSSNDNVDNESASKQTVDQSNTASQQTANTDNNTASQQVSPADGDQRDNTADIALSLASTSLQEHINQAKMKDYNDVMKVHRDKPNNFFKF